MLDAMLLGRGVVSYGIVRDLHAGGTVDADDLAVDPLAVLRGEEADNTGDIDGLADTVHGGPGLGVLLAGLVSCCF